MKVIWSNFASDTLRDIFQYHKKNASERIAQKLKSEIFNTTKQLIDFPNSGQVEPSLKQLKEGHRYLVTGNYKIIYKEIKEGILITDIFDTRQNPTKINNPKRKLSSE